MTEAQTWLSIVPSRRALVPSTLSGLVCGTRALHVAAAGAARRGRPQMSGDGGVASRETSSNPGSPRPCRRSGCRRRSLLSGLVRACPRTSRATQRARSARETRPRPSGTTTRGGVRDLRDRATRVHARGAARSGALSWRRTRQRRRNGPYTTTPLGTNGVYGV